MSIFKNAESRPTHFFLSIGRPVAQSAIQETGEIRPHTLDRNEEWELRLTLSQKFWANRVQRPGVEKIARRALAAELYADVLRELPHLRLCIESGDVAGARESVERIEQATRPD